jgi:hypothetical protein
LEKKMLEVKQIEQKIRENYEPVIKSLPVELQDEFRTKVLPLNEAVELASFIRTTSEFEGRASMGLTQRKIGRKVSVIAFNKKLISANLRPDDIYGNLLKGCFIFD